MYNIVASDLDGTLLTPEHKVAPYTKSVLHRFYQLGEHFVFATGRHHIDVANIRKDVGVPAYMITSNGGRVHDPDNNLVYSANITPSLAHEILDYLEQDPLLFIHIYHGDHWSLNKLTKRLKDYAMFDQRYHIYTDDNKPTEEIIKIFIQIEDPSQKDQSYLIEYEKKLNEKFGDQVHIAFSTPGCLEIMPEGVNKGEALKKVAERLQVPLTHCIAFGDGMNDIEMLSSAGKGIIMGTAPDRVKQTLPHIEVIGSCADEAVAHYLETHLL